MSYCVVHSGCNLGLQIWCQTSVPCTAIYCVVAVVVVVVVFIYLFIFVGGGGGGKWVFVVQTGPVNDTVYED